VFSDGTNVGIGTATPSVPLQVISAFDGIMSKQNTTTGTGISLRSFYPTLGFNRANYNTNDRYIGTGYASDFSLNPTTGRLSYMVYDSGVSGDTLIGDSTRFIIENDGTVRIGMTGDNPNTIITDTSVETDQAIIGALNVSTITSTPEPSYDRRMFFDSNGVFTRASNVFYIGKSGRGCVAIGDSGDGTYNLLELYPKDSKYGAYIYADNGKGLRVDNTTEPFYMTNYPMISSVTLGGFYTKNYYADNVLPLGRGTFGWSNLHGVRYFGFSASTDVEFDSANFGTDIDLAISDGKVGISLDTLPTTTLEVGGRASAHRSKNDSVWHAFGGFQDSAVTIDVTGAGTWAPVKNAAGTLFQAIDYDGITLSGDTMTIANTGHYSGNLAITISGLANKDFSVRVYNITQGSQEGFEISESTNGANNFVSMSLPLFITASAGDKLVLQVTCDTDASDPTFKNSVFYVKFLHK
jgi:hypothetical protein